MRAARAAAAPLGPRPKLSVMVVAALRKQLTSGEIGPGKKLPTEARLTQKFGVSRTVIREAIAALAADGLVQPRQGAGVFALGTPAGTFGALAASSKLSMALNILEMRLAIEVESAALAAARRSPGQEAAMEEAYLEFERQLGLGEPTDSSDFAFHRAIALATGNPVYVEMLDALGERAVPFDATSPPPMETRESRAYQEGLQQEHLAILKAIAGGEPEAARAAMRVHLANSQNRYIARMQERGATQAKDAP